MPQGHVHDRITLWSLPLIAGGTFVVSRDGNLTLLISGGFLFGGLMFGPDLDIYSRQYKRWGWLRWIWLPYQRMLRHRSFWSHGPLVGTFLRIVYLGFWCGLFGAIGLWIAHDFTDIEPVKQWVVQTVRQSLQTHPFEYFALYLGLEVGAMSHSMSDWSHSAYKRWRAGGWAGLLNQPKTARRSASPSLKTLKTKPDKNK
ncbi:MAG: metal-binding protein [Leptolyngbyaceae cyanobacterium bins.59]|nr:metal-binding protein [Leptolyngbyaceae cyanobacterium bins.59]